MVVLVTASFLNILSVILHRVFNETIIIRRLKGESATCCSCRKVAPLECRIIYTRTGMDIVVGSHLHADFPNRCFVAILITWLRCLDLRLEMWLQLIAKSIRWKELYRSVSYRTFSTREVSWILNVCPYSRLPPREWRSLRFPRCCIWENL